MVLETAPQQGIEDSPELFEELAASVPGVLFSYWVSADGCRRTFPFISSRVSALFDASVQMLNQDADVMSSFLHPDEADGLRPSIEESSRTLTPWHYQARLRLRDGTYCWFEGRSLPRRLADGSTLWFGQFMEIQEHKELEAGLREREAEAEYQLEFHKLLASLSSDFINSVIGDIDHEINRFLTRIGRFFEVDRVYVYRFSADMTRMTNTHEWCRQGVHELKDSQQDVDITPFQWWLEQTRSVLRENRVVFIEDVSQLPKTAVAERQLLEEQGVAAMFCIPVVVRGRVEGFFGMDSLTIRCWRRDLSDLLILIANLLSQALERYRLEQELLDQSILDPLTGIHNRRYLEPRVEEMLAQYERTGQGFALAMLDIDHFKQVNDIFGHLAGDYVLQRFAQLLQGECRGTDIGARYGGEEFVIALANVTPESASKGLMRILELARSLEVAFHEQVIQVTASAGVVHVTDFPRESCNLDALITEADRRLYRAKEAGRDCLVDSSEPPDL